MTIGAFLETSTKKLRRAGVESDRLDVLVLLEDDLAKNRAHILAHLDDEMPHATEVSMNTKITQRLDHTPLAYIRGKAAFYGREFLVHTGVLVPRPETETIIDLLKKDYPSAQPLRIADIGTGTGCIGVTAALEFPKAKVDVYDINPVALKLAGRNAQIHGVAVKIFQEDLLSKAGERRYDAILANLPYIPSDLPINKAATHEPKNAIFSGKDGLDAYRTFWRQITAMNHLPSYVLTEALPSQHDQVAQLAKKSKFTLAHTDGYIQQFVSRPTS